MTLSSPRRVVAQQPGARATLSTLLAVGALAASVAATVDCTSSGKATSSLTPPLLSATLSASSAAMAGGVDASIADGSPVDGAPAAVPFQPDPPSVYVAKVKNLLVGLPPTDAEIQAVTADPTQLGPLVDGWMALPQYTQKMMVFFELAFQQTQVAITDFSDQTFPRAPDVNASTQPSLLQNTRESFARTVIELIGEGSPMTDAITTPRLMMTPALMELYAFLDAWQVDDTGKVTDLFHRAHPQLDITVEADAGPIAITDTLNPASPNYMHWYDPDVANDSVMGAGCAQDPIVYPAAADTLHYLIFGSLLGYTNATGGKCLQYGGTATAPQLTAEDFSTWKMVTLRAPAAGETTTAFYDLATLRSATELVLTTPRLGFFTPAFFANWQTNTSNQMRVTINQALIVALGAAVDGTDPTVPTSTPGLDTTHAASPNCFVCHRTLDPTRSILSATYSWNYSNQADPTLTAQDGLFVFQGVQKPVSSLADLASTLSTHPLFGPAWAQKLCYYANSAPCDTTDPEFQRVVAAFAASGYSWNALVRAIMTSPLTTHAVSTKTVATLGEVVSVARRDHLCAALNFRLGLTDVCGLDAITKTKVQTTVPAIVAGLPSDGYGRGATAPVLPNAPTLFYRAGVENICEAVSALVIDNASPESPTTAQWSSAQPDAAIADFVSTVMALTSSDPRAAQAQSLLAAHFASAVASGASASNALKSTFVVACLAPTSIAIGL